MTTSHWNYYSAIENDLIECSRYVEFSKQNFATYSIEFAQILLRAGSEVNMLANVAAERDRGQGKWKVLRKEFPKLADWEIDVPRHQLKLTPWFAWTLEGDQRPCWFDAFTDIKHHRETRFEQANLCNTLGAVGGLLLLLTAMQLRGIVGEPKPQEPRLFVPSQEYLSEAKDHALPWEDTREW